MEKENLTIPAKMVLIQNELKAPKSRYNKFGNYNYRNCEDIMEAVKPLLKKYDLFMSLTDEVVEIGGRLFVKAEASVSDGKTSIRTTAYAGHNYEQKGMDFAQITGAASSYARKYCLNGLFLIDDTKDADTDEYHQQTTAPQPQAVKPNQVKHHEKEGAILFHLETAASMADLEQILKDFDLTREQLKEYPSLREQFNNTAQSFKK